MKRIGPTVFKGYYSIAVYAVPAYYPSDIGLYGFKAINMIYKKLYK